MPTSTGVGGDLRDGLALCQSHSDRLSGKEVVVSRSKEHELVSSQGVMRELQDGAQCYMIFTHMEVERGETTSVIPVVQDFVDVFPEEVPGLPPIERWSSLLI